MSLTGSPSPYCAASSDLRHARPATWRLAGRSRSKMGRAASCPRNRVRNSPPALQFGHDEADEVLDPRAGWVWKHQHEAVGGAAG